MTFIDDYLVGTTTLDAIDDYVARWHEGVTSINQFLKTLIID